MAYTPSLDDIPNMGFSPSIEDVPNQEPAQEAAQSEPMSLVDHAKNFGANLAAGGIGSVIDILKKIPSPADWEPEGLPLSQVMPKTGERPIDKFDPYKALGTERAPITSAAGIEQFIGSLISPGALGAKPAVKIMSFFRKIEPVKLLRQLQKEHDFKMATNSGLFDKVQQEATNRGVGNIFENNPSAANTINKAIDSIVKKLPKTDQMKDFVKKARSGNYADLRKFQTEIRRRGTKWKNSDDVANQNASELLLEVKDKINNEIYKHLENTGNKDLASDLRNAMSGWAKLKQVYYGKKNPFTSIVEKESRKIPKDAWNVLTTESVPVSRVLNEHPEIAREVALHVFRKKLGANKALKSVMWIGKKGGGLAAGGALAGLGFEGGRKLTHYYDE